MDTAPENNTQPQERQSGGELGRGINLINNLAGNGLKNPLGKIASKAAIQVAARGIGAFLIGPGLPILIAVAISIFTFIIVGSGGAIIVSPTTEPATTPPAGP